MSGWHLAQYNIAWCRWPLDDARMQGFVSELDRVNGIGDRSAGFVWRHQAADGNSTSVRVRDDPRIIVNFTVWESVEALFEYAFHSGHADVYRRRKEWFDHFDEPYAVLWWVPAGHVPTVEEAEERLAVLKARGPTAEAFTFKSRFAAPAAEG